MTIRFRLELVYFYLSFLFTCSLCWSSYNLNTNNLTIRKNLTSKIKIRLWNEQILVGNRIEFRELNAASQALIHTNIVYEFLGIPFAQAPLNQKRFQFPFELDSLLPGGDEYDASHQRDSCQQEFDYTFPGFSGSEMWNPPGNVSEDCLFMNIWVPVSPLQDKLFQLESLKPNWDLKYVSNGFTLDNNKAFMNKSTLFWLYGGSFITGTINLDVYDGAFLAAVENVITVSSNYRLGVFGFAYLNNEKAPGNAGLADQLKAVEWYRNNYMGFFGGDGSKVCLFGESAGAMSLHFLLQSEKNNLFNRLIFQSSSSYLEYTYRKPSDAYQVTLQYAEKIGCLPVNTRPKLAKNLPFETKFYRNASSESESFNNEILSCMLKQNASYLSTKQYDVDYVNEYLKMQFIPTADYFNLVKQDPSEFYFDEKRKLLTHDILAGVNQNEGTYFSFYLYNEVYFNLTGQFFNSKNPREAYDNQFVADRLGEALRTKNPPPTDSQLVSKSEVAEQFYFKKFVNCLENLYTVNGKLVSLDNLNESGVWDFDLNSSENRRLNSASLAWRKFSKIIGDYMFACPTIKLANKYSQAKPFNAYFYRFNKRSMRNPWPEWFGVSHGFEIEYVFGKPWLAPNLYDDEDRLVSRRMMNYWANFARTGKLSSEYDSKAREFFVDLKPSSKSGDESDEIELMQKIFTNCYAINKIKNTASYAQKYEECAVLRAGAFNQSNRSFSFKFSLALISFFNLMIYLAFLMIF